MRGIIKFYNEEREFGFISSTEIYEDLYFNKKSFRSDRRPYKKQKVEFKVIETERGKAADDIYLLRYD
jgi:cold shock CspA family protein